MFLVQQILFFGDNKKQWNTTDIDYIFDRQGKVGSIPGYVVAAFTPFGAVSNRTYENGLVASFEYDFESNRLNRISIPGIQDVNYTYDGVGNILSITDSVGGRNHVLSYDNLDRLIEANVGTERYVYAYSPIGQIMKIVQNNESQKFVYNEGPVHAPSKIINGSSGVDVYHVSELESTTKNRTFEFFLENDRNESTYGVNWSIDFGSEMAASALNVSLHSNVMVIVQNNYSKGGVHNFTITSQSPGIEDREGLDLYFGARAEALSAIYVNRTERIFEFIVHNDLNELITNVSWNCSEGINGTYSTDLDADGRLFDYIHHNYSVPGQKTFGCSAVSEDGNESISITFDVEGVSVSDYDILVTNVSKRLVSFSVINGYLPLDTNISVGSSDDAFSVLSSIDSGENVLVFAEMDYSSDGAKSVEIDLITDNYSNEYIESFAYEGASISDYSRVNGSILLFDVRNNWHSGMVNWSVSDLGIDESTALEYNETLLVMVAANTTSLRTDVSAAVNSFVDMVSDVGVLYPVHVDLDTLSEGTSAVSELILSSLSAQNVTWSFSNSLENVSSSVEVSDQVFVFVETNQSAGVYRTTASVNSSSCNDSSIGVIVS